MFRRVSTVRVLHAVLTNHINVVFNPARSSALAAMNSTPSEALDEAIKQTGGTKQLADRLAVTVQVVSNWRARGVPAERCPDIERVTGVRCERLRPDVNWDVLRVAGRNTEE